MNERRQHLDRAWVHLGQAIELLQRAKQIEEGEDDADVIDKLDALEDKLMRMLSAESCDTRSDDRYNEQVERKMLEGV